MYWPTLLTCLALVSGTPIKRAPGTFNIRPSGATSFVSPRLISFPLLPLLTSGPQCLGTTQTPANGVALYNIPCDRPAGSDPAYLNYEFEPTVPGVVRLSGTNFCVDAGLGFNECMSSALFFSLDFLPLLPPLFLLSFLIYRSSQSERQPTTLL